MNQLQRTLISKSLPKIKFYTSMFYVTLNCKELNDCFSSLILSEFMILDLAGIDIRDVIGWHDSC